MRLARRSFLQILAGSIVAATALQTEWALDHGFESYNVRVFTTVLVFFIAFQAVRLLLSRMLPAPDKRFKDNYSEIVLLLSLLPVFLLIENTVLRWGVMICYVVLVAGFAAEVLRIPLCLRAQSWVSKKSAHMFSSFTGKRLRYFVEDDVEPGVLHVRVRCLDRDTLTSSEIRNRLLDLYQLLPDARSFDSIQVRVDELKVDDAMLLQLLEPLHHYARIVGLSRVVVVDDGDRLSRLSGHLPEERYLLRESG